MATRQVEPSIDEYLRKRLMPVEGAIPQLAGIDMYGNSIPASTVGGDLFEYINFQQRYNIDARIARALKLSKDYLEPLPKGETPRNAVDAHVQWLKTRPGYKPVCRSRVQKSEKFRTGKNLPKTCRSLYTTAGVLLVDAQGHGIISAKIASTVHDTFHSLMLSELDHSGKTTPGSSRRSISGWRSRSLPGTRWEGTKMTIRVRSRPCSTAKSVPAGHFRFVNFGHPPPLVFSAEFDRFMEIDDARMVQFLALGLEIPEDHPDRNKYLSMAHPGPGRSTRRTWQKSRYEPGRPALPLHRRRLRRQRRAGPSS